MTLPVIDSNIVEKTKGRRTDYLRISVTDRCNLRCSYCMPEEGIIPQPHDRILTFEEIERLVRIFVSLGGRKVRLTGGDPLVRRGIVNLIERLNDIEGMEEVCVTTNGVLLPAYAEDLKRAGVKKINISLDTLKEDRFKLITRGEGFFKVMEGIDKIKGLGFQSIKLNMVVMKGINEDEILDFVRFSLNEGLTLRFIEFMRVTPLWEEGHLFPIEKVKEICSTGFRLERIGHMGSGPAEYYKIENNIVGFIKTDEKNCSRCGRLRLTSTGELKACLYEDKGICLRSLLRGNASDEKIRDIIKSKIGLKEYINYTDYESSTHYMCNIGG